MSRFLEERWAWGFGLAALVAPVVHALVSAQDFRALVRNGQWATHSREDLDRIDGT